MRHADAKEIERLLGIARRGAMKASADPQVVEEAASHAVTQFRRYEGSISADHTSREAWIKLVAANHARRVGRKLHRDLAMGAAGSAPPPMSNTRAEEHVGKLIKEMRRGGGIGLSSAVAIRVDFQKRWSLLGGEARSLLHAKYVEGFPTKVIARQMGLAPATVDNKLTAAKATARILLADLMDQMLGNWEEED